MDAQKIEPYAWSSFNVLTGTEYIQKLPITSLQPGVYKNFPLYDAQTLASKEAELVRLRAALANFKAVAQSCLSNTSESDTQADLSTANAHQGKQRDAKP